MIIKNHFVFFYDLRDRVKRGDGWLNDSIENVIVNNNRVFFYINYGKDIKNSPLYCIENGEKRVVENVVRNSFINLTNDKIYQHEYNTLYEYDLKMRSSTNFKLKIM